MSGYPILVQLEGRTALIIGGGSVATRKAENLLETGARVLVIAPLLNPRLQTLAKSGKIEVREQVYQPGMIAALPIRPVLIFAATDSPHVNHQVLDEARTLGILANLADETAHSDFHSMATVRRDEITIAISTASPALSIHLRREIEQVLGEEYAVLSRWLRELRPLIRERIAIQADRAAFWRRVIESPVLVLLREGDEARARRILDALVEGIF